MPSSNVDTMEGHVGRIEPRREGVSLAGGGPNVLGPVEDVVHVEGVADDTTGGARSITAWLFHRSDEPHMVDVDHLTRLAADDSNFLWVDLSDYREEDMREVARQLNLHRAAVHAALSRWQRPRLDVYDSQYFVSATIARLDDDRYRVHASQLDLFVGRNYLVSVHKTPLPLAARIMDRARQIPVLMQEDSAHMLYIILDELLRYYEDLREHLQGQIEVREERALTETSDDVLEDFLHFKRYAFALSQLVAQHREVLGAFLRPDFPFVAGEDMPMYFRDLESRLLRLMDDLAAVRDAVNGAFDIYVSHVSHRTNQVIKVLTVVSTVLLPVTVILGFFSTQFRDVPVYGNGAFIIMLIAVLAVPAGILLAFRRKGWI